MALELHRRQLLRLGLAAAAAWQLEPWAVHAVAAPAAGDPLSPVQVAMTLEAFSDTMIPGEKRYPADQAIAGAVNGSGAVQGGALDFMRFPPVGVAPALPALAAAINAKATLYAALQRLTPDPALPPFVALDFVHRTRLAVDLLDFSQPTISPTTRSPRWPPSPSTLPDTCTRSTPCGRVTRA